MACNSSTALPIPLQDLPPRLTYPSTSSIDTIVTSDPNSPVPSNTLDEPSTESPNSSRTLAECQQGSSGSRETCDDRPPALTQLVPSQKTSAFLGWMTAILSLVVTALALVPQYRLWVINIWKIWHQYWNHCKRIEAEGQMLSSDCKAIIKDGLQPPAIYHERIRPQRYVKRNLAQPTLFYAHYTITDLETIAICIIYAILFIKITFIAYSFCPHRFSFVYTRRWWVDQRPNSEMNTPEYTPHNNSFASKVDEVTGPTHLNKPISTLVRIQTPGTPPHLNSLAVGSNTNVGPTADPGSHAGSRPGMGDIVFDQASYRQTTTNELALISGLETTGNCPFQFFWNGNFPWHNLSMVAGGKESIKKCIYGCLSWPLVCDYHSSSHSEWNVHCLSHFRAHKLPVEVFCPICATQFGTILPLSTDRKPHLHRIGNEFLHRLGKHFKRGARIQPKQLLGNTRDIGFIIRPWKHNIIKYRERAEIYQPRCRLARPPNASTLTSPTKKILFNLYSNGQKYLHSKRQLPELRLSNMLDHKMLYREPLTCSVGTMSFRLKFSGYQNLVPCMLILSTSLDRNINSYPFSQILSKVIKKPAPISAHNHNEDAYGYLTATSALSSIVMDRIAS